MKYNELYKKLRKAGCFLLHHGARHDLWVNPSNGKQTRVGRHGTEEVPSNLNKYMAQKIKVIVETGRDLFSCFMVGKESELTGLHGDGKTARKAIDDFYLCYEEEKQDCREKGKKVPDLEFKFIFDIGAFFSFYMINVSAFAAYAGMNASLLRQYACGLKSPTKATIKKIKDAIEKYKKDIDAGCLINRPVPQYI